MDTKLRAMLAVLTKALSDGRIDSLRMEFVDNQEGHVVLSNDDVLAAADDPPPIDEELADLMLETIDIHLVDYPIH